MTLILNLAEDLFEKLRTLPFARSAQWPLNCVFHPASSQSWVSFVDFAYAELVPMEESAAARLPAVVLEWHADTIGGTEYKVFYVRMPNLNQTGNLSEIVRILPRSRALQLHDLLIPGQLNYVFHPVSFQSWVSFGDIAYTDLLLMETNAIALPPAAVLEW